MAFQNPKTIIETTAFFSHIDNGKCDIPHISVQIGNTSNIEGFLCDLPANPVYHYRCLTVGDREMDGGNLIQLPFWKHLFLENLVAMCGNGGYLFKFFDGGYLEIDFNAPFLGVSHKMCSDPSGSPLGRKGFPSNLPESENGNSCPIKDLHAIDDFSPDFSTMILHWNTSIRAHGHGFPWLPRVQIHEESGLLFRHGLKGKRPHPLQGKIPAT